MNSQAEIGVSSHFPFVGEQRSIKALYPDILYSTSNCVKPSRHCDDVEFVERAIFLSNTVGFEFNDRIGLDIDHVHVRFVELIIEVLF